MPQTTVGSKQIEDYIEASEPDTPGTANRCSAATMCVKRRWYQNRGLPGEKITARKRINFLLGDLAELTVQHFIEKACVGPGKLYSEVDFGHPIGHMPSRGITFYEQKTLHLDVPNGPQVTGHIDGLGKRNLDGKWELIEIKSSSNYGFDSFLEEGPGDYIKQAHACMMTKELMALDVKTVRYFYLKKETGHIADQSFQFNDSIAHTVLKEFSIAFLDTEPEKPYGLKQRKDGVFIAQFPCSFCPYLERCQGKYTMEFKNHRVTYVFGNKPNTGESNVGGL